MLNSMLEYSSYYKNSVNENSQEAFLMWVFLNGKEKTNEVSKMAKELIKTLCKLDVDYENIKISKLYNQVGANNKRVDIKVQFEIGEEKHTLIIEHKVNSLINNPFTAYIDSIINEDGIPHFACISLKDKRDEGFQFKSKKEKGYYFELFKESFIAVVERYKERHWLINDYFNNYIYDPGMSLSYCTGNYFQKTMNRLFLNIEICGFSVAVQSKAINFTKNKIKVIFNKETSKNYHFKIENESLREKLKNSGLFKGGKNANTPRTNFVLKDSKELEDIKSVKNVCEKFLNIVNENIK